MVDGKEVDLTISASEEFVKQLTEQWQSIIRSQTNNGQ